MSKILSKFRFLGITIFIAALMLSVKISSIVDGFAGISIAGAEAQQPQENAESATKPVTLPGVQPPSSAPPLTSLPGVSVTKPGVKKAATFPGPGGPVPPGPGGPGASSAAEAVSKFITNDPTLLTQTEIDLLQKLSSRRESLDKRERQLEIRFGLLQAAQSRIDKKVKSLKVLQNTIENLLKSHEEEQSSKLQSLVKIYENMKPKDAARIFQQLDMVTLLKVVEGMKERKLAPIMAKMNPDKARDITVQLTNLRQLPDVGS